MIETSIFNMVFIEYSNLFITQNIHRKGVWLDYALIVAESQYNQNLLEEETIDQTKEFIEKCGQDHFYIQLNASEFCKQAVFSLTADYNSGALPCNCDYEGSTSFECDPFGGQCQCKPNIIGRQCDACRTGKFGLKNNFYREKLILFKIYSARIQVRATYIFQKNLMNDKRFFVYEIHPLHKFI